MGAIDIFALLDAAIDAINETAVADFGQQLDTSKGRVSNVKPLILNGLDTLDTVDTANQGHMVSEGHYASATGRHGNGGVAPVESPPSRCPECPECPNSRNSAVCGLDTSAAEVSNRCPNHESVEPPCDIEPLRAGAAGWTAEDWQAFFEERASIAEFDAGLPRPRAEARAFDCCISEWLNRHPVRSSPERCVACGEQTHDPLLPFGIESQGHAWLHSRCWPAWHAGRKAEGVAALTAMGVAPPADLPDGFGGHAGS
jgi:hypothetical protein